MHPLTRQGILSRISPTVVCTRMLQLEACPRGVHFVPCFTFRRNKAPEGRAPLYVSVNYYSSIISIDKNRRKIVITSGSLAEKKIVKNVYCKTRRCCILQDRSDPESPRARRQRSCRPAISTRTIVIPTLVASCESIIH